MEHDSEPLDWGNEDEEQKETYRRASQDNFAGQEYSADADGGAEDTISLGDEEEDGYYFQRELPRRFEDDADSASMPEDSRDRPSSPRRRADSMGANEQPRYQDGPREVEHFERAPSRTSNAHIDSPTREKDQDHSWRQQTSPSQITTTRLTHALPPKPVTANVPYLPPSHPSIVAATSMTDPTLNGTTPTKTATVKPAAPSGTNDVPHPWVLRRPRHGGEPYYYNSVSGENAWQIPVSNLSSSSSGQVSRRPHNGSTTDAYMTQSNSNMHQSQNQSRPEHDDSRARIDQGEEVATSERRRNGFADRHYRPGGLPANATVPASGARDIRPSGRDDLLSDHYPSRSRYERSPPPPSSPRQRRRTRSSSPVARPPPSHPRNADHPASRNNLNQRDRNGYTNSIPPVSQQRDPDMSRDRWPSSHLPPTDYDRSERANHKPFQRLDDRDYPQLPPDEPRPYVRRRESDRGHLRERDREQSRYADEHQYPAAGNHSFQSSSRTYERDREPTRGYPPHRERSGAPYPEHKDRTGPFDRGTGSTGQPVNVAPPPPRESYNPRPRDYEERPAAPYDQRRNREREFDRSRREVPPVAPYQSRRPPVDYPPRQNVSAPTVGKANRYPETYDRLPAEDPTQVSHHRREPLPPQTASFMSAPPGRDLPPHSNHLPVQDDAPKDRHPPGWANLDPTLPRQPRVVANMFLEREKRAKERQGSYNSDSTGQDERSRATMDTAASSVATKHQVSTPPYSQDRRNITAPEERDRDREYPPRPPRLDTRMDVDRREVVTDNRRPTSPRGPRSALPPRHDEEDRYPRGPRSARPTYTPNERSSAYTPVTSIPPPNGRYDIGYPPTPGPPRDIHPVDERRFSDNRNEWREKRSVDAHTERGPMPPQRDFRNVPVENGRPPPPPPPPPAASGTNNVPIGTRRNNMPIPSGPSLKPFNPGPPPQLFGYNPDAMPPPSTLIRQPAPDAKRGPERHDKLANDIADDLHKTDAKGPVPPPSTFQTDAEQPSSAASRQSPLSVEADKAKRRVSRFSPLVPRPELDQNQPTQQNERRHTPEEFHKRTIKDEPGVKAEPGVKVEPTTKAGIKVEPTSEGPPARRDDRPAQSRFANRANVTPPHSEAYRPETSQPSSSEPGRTPRSRYRWTEQMAHAAAAPDSPEAAIEQKPPRHRKYSARYVASEEVTTEVSSEDRKTTQEGPLSFRERLEAPSQIRRGSTTTMTLLDRLSSAQDSVHVSPEASNIPTPSLRDRLVPSKRDRDDMAMEGIESNGQGYEVDDGTDAKRIKRRGSKVKRGGRR